MPLTKSKGETLTRAQRYQRSPKGKATKRAWMERNRDKVNRWKNKWASSENGRAQARSWYRKSPSAMFDLYKRSAVRRGLSFVISKEVFLGMIAQPCHYCGHKVTPPDRNGLDRVDNALGYEPGNLVPCCTACNQMKGKRAVEGFLAHCASIVLHQMEVNPDAP